jgi:8-oxo-(d)GTP phosphatase
VPSENFVPALTLPGTAQQRSSQTKPILAGGAVVTREDPVRGTEVLIIHRTRYNDWTLPKGKLDAGESLPACAVREVLEETGVTIRLGVPLDTVRYDTANGVKQVEYWGGTVLDTAPRPPDDEVDVVSWLPVRAALSRLTYAHDHFLVQQYLDQPPTTPLIIVRHGKAMDRKDWSKKDTARPVNARGRRQSRLLVPMLGAYGISRLVSSTSARCIGTLEPYAHARQLTIDKFSQLTEEVGGDDPRAVAKLILKRRTAVLATGEPTAICVHRPVLPHILDALDMAPTTLVTGEFLVAHLTSDGEVHALERHRPQA